MEGFWDYSQVRFVENTKMPLSILGVLQSLKKNHIRFGLKLVEDTERFLRFRLEMFAFQLKNDIFLRGANNIPPNNITLTITTKTDYFGKLNEILIK